MCGRCCLQIGRLARSGSRPGKKRTCPHEQRSERHLTLEACLRHYSGMEHRKRRWKVAIKTQKSESKLYNKIRDLKTDERPILLAYGSWGVVAGKAGAACNKGLPPCIGSGLLKKLSKHFVTCVTPEAYTSKTCCRCFSPCERWREKEEEMFRKRTSKKKEIRGLRRCQNEECRFLPLNRDKNAATNIGYNFQRLFRGEAPIRKLSKDEILLNRFRVACHQCD